MSEYALTDNATRSLYHTRCKAENVRGDEPLVPSRDAILISFLLKDPPPACDHQIMSRVPITEDVLKELRELREQSGMSGQRLLRRHKDAPEGLNSSIISQWIQGNVKTARAEHLEYVLDLWRNVDPVIKITESIRDQVNREFERTGLQMTSFVRASQQAKHLDSNKISRIRTGKCTEIAKSHLDLLLSELSEFPDKRIERRSKKACQKAEYVPGETLGRLGKTYARREPKAAEKYVRILSDDLIRLKEADVRSLFAERERTGVGAIALLRKFSETKPDKLSANTISAWMNGHAKFASKSRLQWVLDCWRSLSDKTDG